MTTSSELAAGDLRRASRAGLLAGLRRAESTAVAARLTLQLEADGVVTQEQADASVNMALNAARALDEARAIDLAAHGRGHVRR